MADPLRGPLLKIGRAKQHVAILNAEVANYLNRRPYRLVVERKDQWERWVTKVSEELPDSVPLIIGDAAHALISALDHLVFLFVQPDTDEMTRRVQFPFSRDASTLESAIKSRFIDRAGPEVVNAIRGCMPYRGPGGNEWFCSLQDLDIIDKHRLIVPVVGATTIKARLKNNTGLDWNLADHKFGPLVHDLHVMSTIPTQNLNIGDEIPAVFSIQFPNGTPFGDQPVCETLVQAADYIGRIVESFRFFIGRPGCRVSKA
jgi:hypothetical protein